MGVPWLLLRGTGMLNYSSRTQFLQFRAIYENRKVASYEEQSFLNDNY